MTVPAREIIHDRMNCLFHPLVGTPPVFASGLASMLGLNAQRASALLFENASTPGGILTAPGEVSEDQQAAVQGGMGKPLLARSISAASRCSAAALKYEKVAMTHVEGQMVENLKWSAEVVCCGLPCAALQGRRRRDAELQQRAGAQHRILFAARCRASSRRSRSCSTTRSASAGATGSAPNSTPTTCCAWIALTLVTTIRDAVGAGVMSPNEGRSQARPQAGRGRRVALPAAAELFAGGAGQARRAGRSVRHRSTARTACRER